MNLPDNPEWRRIFQHQILQVGDCWLWTGGLNHGGYGQVTYKRKKMNASRLSFVLIHNCLDTRLCVLHNCDNPPCVNPDHLILGTQLENLQDMTKKGRLVNGNIILTEDQVLEMRALHGTGLYTLGMLAEIFPVSLPTISKIVNRKLWKHIP